MRFNEWTTMHARLLAAGVLPPDARKVSALEFCRLNVASGNHANSVGTEAHLIAEGQWLADKRPYYSLYPVAADALAKLRLDIPWRDIRLPLTPLLLQCAVGHEPDAGDNRRILSVLIADTSQRSEEAARWLCWADLGESRPDFNNMSDVSTLFLCAPDDWTVEQSIDFAIQQGNRRADLGLAQPETMEYARTVARLLAGVSLLASDPDMVTPDVLGKDRPKLADADDDLLQKLIGRAHRRGKVGWLFGAEMESIPHWRRPHFALRWTGKGKAVPKIVPVKGAVVHRTKLADVPHGRLDETKVSRDASSEAEQLQLAEKLNECSDNDHIGPERN